MLGSSPYTRFTALRLECQVHSTMIRALLGQDGHHQCFFNKPCQMNELRLEESWTWGWGDSNDMCACAWEDGKCVFIGSCKH